MCLTPCTLVHKFGAGSALKDGLCLRPGHLVAVALPVIPVLQAYEVPGIEWLPPRREECASHFSGSLSKRAVSSSVSLIRSTVAAESILARHTTTVC